jgi:hypothetical protein
MPRTGYRALIERMVTAPHYSLTGRRWSGTSHEPLQRFVGRVVRERNRAAREQEMLARDQRLFAETGQQEREEVPSRCTARRRVI